MIIIYYYHVKSWHTFLFMYVTTKYSISEFVEVMTFLTVNNIFWK